jgi:hypothetical protein
MFFFKIISIAKKIISFSGQFPKLFFVVVIISVGSNAVAVYTGNNHACL